MKSATTRMTADEARTYLTVISARVIGAVYDDPATSEALSVLMPGFEYPDWDKRTVREFLRAVAGPGHEEVR